MTTVTWNPDDTNVAISLSNGNLTATQSVTAWKSARATEFKDGGKLYFELTHNAGTYSMCGIGRSSATVDNYPGSNTNSWGYMSQNGNKFYNSSGVSFGSTFTTNDVVGIAVDIDSGKLWFAKNNTWQASGNPATGANPAFTGVTGELAPMVGLYQSGAQVTGSFKADDCTYSPPSGFSYWEMPSFYFSGYIYERTNPVSRKVYVYNRDTGVLMNSTTSSGNGYYYLTTTYSGSHFIVALDDDGGDSYNLARLDKMIPAEVEE